MEVLAVLGVREKRDAALTALTKLNKCGGTDPTLKPATLSVVCYPFTCVHKTGLEQNPNKNISNALLFGFFVKVCLGFFSCPDSCQAAIPVYYIFAITHCFNTPLLTVLNTVCRYSLK